MATNTDLPTSSQRLPWAGPSSGKATLREPLAWVLHPTPNVHITNSARATRRRGDLIQIPDIKIPTPWETDKQAESPVKWSFQNGRHTELLPRRICGEAGKGLSIVGILSELPAWSVCWISQSKHRSHVLLVSRSNQRGPLSCDCVC